MSTAILRIPAPESCRLCNLIYFRKGGMLTYCMEVGYKDSRHPDCPLEITEDNLRWIEDPDTFSEKLICPKCKGVHDYCSIFYDNYKYCPNCGVRLLHPKEWEK